MTENVEQKAIIMSVQIDWPRPPIHEFCFNLARANREDLPVRHTQWNKQDIIVGANTTVADVLKTLTTHYTRDILIRFQQNQCVWLDASNAQKKR